MPTRTPSRRPPPDRATVERNFRRYMAGHDYLLAIDLYRIDPTPERRDAVFATKRAAIALDEEGRAA
jgi:hypothetical protein